MRCLARRNFLVALVFAYLVPAAALAAPFDDVEVGVSGVGEAIGDTLTVIMKPLLNIPSFVQQGDGLTISCEAPSTTTGWAAELIHGTTRVPLTVYAASYSASTLWWTLSASVPTGIVNELYDLRVTAAGGIDDTTRHAVKVIPAFLTSYYFVHVTDSHAPTNKYYTETGAATDSASTIDLREVINDINIINPEFVLHTGDLINEGELEDYLTFREYTRAQRIIAESQVPFFVTAGNHDIGGWDATPPTDGTARRNWWRFFGWKRLANPPAGAPARTQDYSFDYGPVHYTGLEGYLNYDNWLPTIYGTQSFTASQVSWLGTDLAAAAGSAAQVLFFHNDFANELNLATLGVEMALWGHIHSDSGSLTTMPYDLSTANTDNGKRTYRVIKVNNGVLTPYASVTAGSTGQNLRVTYAPANNGSASSVTATVVNGLPLRFENGLLKFVMPRGPANYIVTNGTLLQTEATPTTTIVHVRADLLANATRTVTVTEDLTGVGDTPNAPRLAPNAPNPFNPRTSFTFTLPQAGRVTLSLFDARGELVRRLVAGETRAGEHTVEWDGRSDAGENLSSGVYFARLETAGGARTVKATLVR